MIVPGLELENSLARKISKVAGIVVEALKEIGASESSKLVMMPLDAAGVTGAVGGIAELIKDVGAHASGVKG